MIVAYSASSPSSIAIRRRGALESLLGLHRADKNLEAGRPIAISLVEAAGRDTKSLMAAGSFLAESGDVGSAESLLKEAFEKRGSGEAECRALSSFYLQPHGNRRRFEEAIGVLEACAASRPDDPAQAYLIATFYWEAAFRDPQLSDSERVAYADKGLSWIDKALAVEPEKVEPLVYKGLLLRVKARFGPPQTRAALLKQAEALANRAQEIRRNAIGRQ